MKIVIGGWRRIITVIISLLSSIHYQIHKEIEMKIDEFITKYSGKKVDFDGAYGAQCVDLFRQYCKDVLGLPHTGAVEGAEGLWNNYDKLPVEQKYFERIDSDYVPLLGDV